jgi:hypothetical protein
MFFSCTVIRIKLYGKYNTTAWGCIVTGSMHHFRFYLAGQSKYGQNVYVVWHGNQHVCGLRSEVNNNGTISGGNRFYRHDLLEDDAEC